MVNPVDAAGPLLGIPTAGPDGQAAPPSPGRLFTLALLRAGKDECTCETCRFCQQIADLMVEQASAGGRAAAPTAAAYVPPMATGANEAPGG